MYIDPFWAGVLATIGSEILLLIVIAIREAIKRVKNGN